jgi:hypothetical protein
VAVLIEVVVERGVDRAKFLERFHAPESEHRALASSEWLV